ncbi:myb-like domain, Myb/SANT-like DNA-binding domain protein [Artemisia annua]|uniref:Myb-like domain, Myb/SANT-like DNA-binding domain protein n=1 Tax=Artemisia annua TaxID=35608 RepID=A0A2U1PUP8_ARTAN|nr:myb-like domain, Myb/SANT-like DNA-binding domain protein [Artemisia annua]
MACYCYFFRNELFMLETSDLFFLLQAYKIAKTKIPITRLDKIDTEAKIIRLLLLELDSDVDSSTAVTKSYEDVQVVKGKTNTKADKKPWTSAEEMALAKAWVHVSTCQKVRNEQGRDKFWGRILEHFEDCLKDTMQTHRSLNTKWQNMNAAMGVFNGIYIQQD